MTRVLDVVAAVLLQPRDDRVRLGPQSFALARAARAASDGGTLTYHERAHGAVDE